MNNTNYDFLQQTSNAVQATNLKIVEKVVLMPVDSLSHHPDSKYRLNNIEELAESIRVSGQKEPLEINQDKQVISGNRRLEALKLAGIPNAKVRVKIYKNSIEERNAIAVYNDKRDLSVSEKALSLQYKLDFYEYEGQNNVNLISKVATEFEISERSVKRYLLINKFSDEIKALFDEKKLRVKDIDKIAEAIANGYDHTNILSLFQLNIPKGQPKEIEPVNIEIKAFKKKLKNNFNMKARINANKKQLILKFENEEELDKLIQLMEQQME